MQQDPIHQRIKTLREQRGWSKADLGRRAGVSDVSVMYWESGQIKSIRHDHLLGIACAFGVTVSELVGDPGLQADRDRHAAEVLREFADHLPSDTSNPDVQAGIDKARDLARRMAEGYVPESPVELAKPEQRSPKEQSATATTEVD